MRAAESSPRLKRLLRVALSASFGALLAGMAFAAPAGAFPEVSIGGQPAAPPLDPGADVAAWSRAATVQLTWEVQHGKPMSEAVLEVNASKHVVWSYVTNTRPGSISAPLPTRAVRLSAGVAGLTLISDQFNHQVIAVDHAKHIVFAQGKVGVPGNGHNQLYGPYDAKIIGDFFGLTPP